MNSSLRHVCRIHRRATAGPKNASSASFGPRAIEEENFYGTTVKLCLAEMPVV